MAIRIQLRHDTSTNWSNTNPLLYPGEFGVETDTLKIKVGPMVESPAVGTAWNSISSYANITATDLGNSLGDYIELGTLGQGGGPAELTLAGNLVVPGQNIIIEGATEDSYELTLHATDPTADRTITFPDETGTVATQSYVDNAISAFDALPSQPGNDGKFLRTDGTNTLWATLDLSSKQDKVTGVSDTEIGYLDGVTSKIQDQIDAKVSTSDLANAFTNYTDSHKVTYATTGNIAGSYSNGVITGNTNATLVVDGNSVIAEDLLLVKNQSTDTHNGIYIVTAPGISSTTTYSPTVGYERVYTVSTWYNITNIRLSDGSTYNMGQSFTLDGRTFDGAYFPYWGTYRYNIPFEEYVTYVDNPVYTCPDGGTYDSNTNSCIITNAAEPHVLTRVANFDTAAKMDGQTFFVELGNTLASTLWIMDNQDGSINVNKLPTMSEIQTSLNTKVEQSDIDTAIANLIDSAPSTLDTLNELAAAINDDESYASTITTALGNKQDKVSGVSDTEIGYLDGVTSKIQDQIDGKQDKVTGVSDTEIGYLDGVTSAIQTQLNAKATLSGAETLSNKTLDNPTITVGSGTTSIQASIWPGSYTQVGTTLRIPASSYNDFGVATFNGATAVGFSDIGDANGIYPVISLDGSYLSVDVSSANTAGFSSFLNIIQGGGYTGQLHFGSSSTISSTEISYLDGTSSNIQNQIDDKAPLDSPTFTGDVDFTGATVIGIDALPDQTDNAGKYLKTDGTSASWETLLVPITTGTATISGNTAATIDTTSLADFTSIEYTVSLKQGSKIRTSKVLVQTDGTSVDMTEFGITETGGVMSGVVVAASAASTDCTLKVTVTDASSTNVTAKISKVSL